MLSVVEPRPPEEPESARALMHSFVAWAREALTPDTHLLDRYFAGPVFEAELDGLPSRYAPPGGRLLVAVRGPEPLGIVARRVLGEDSCEMKRMFVVEAGRGMGIGRILVDRLLDEARADG